MNSRTLLHTVLYPTDSCRIIGPAMLSFSNPKSDRFGKNVQLILNFFNLHLLHFTSLYKTCSSIIISPSIRSSLSPDGRNRKFIACVCPSSLSAPLFQMSLISPLNVLTSFYVCSYLFALQFLA